jgi:hypothetical protein
LVGTTRLTKALMDGGSVLNLMYLNTFEGLGLPRDQLQSSPHLFYRVVLGKQSIPLRWLTMLVTFRDSSNYRTETLAFEVVDFSGPYHIILGWPCYVKFMASYAYLKLKTPEPIGVIIMETTTQRVLDCEWDINELAAAVVAMAKLRELSLQVPTEPLISAMPPTSGIFKMDEDAKVVQIDARDHAKTVQIGASLDPK